MTLEMQNTFCIIQLSPTDRCDIVNSMWSVEFAVQCFIRCDIVNNIYWAVITRAELDPWCPAVLLFISLHPSHFSQQSHSKCDKSDWRKNDICGVNFFSAELLLLYPPKHHHNIPSRTSIGQEYPQLSKGSGGG